MDKRIEAWKVLKKEYLFKQPWLTVRAQQMELPNGSIIPSYYVFEYPSWIAVIAVRTDGKLVMVRQYRPGAEKVMTELCAGVVDPDDCSPMDAAKRELREETGYGGGKWEEWMVSSANPGTHNNLVYCYLALGVEKEGESSPEATEDLAVEVLEPTDVLRLLENDEILQAVHAAALWKYFYRQK